MAINEFEKVLIRKAVMGDEASFETLIFSCKGKAYNIAFRYLHNQEDALDALQESFIKIYRNLSKFNHESSFDTWVYRIVVNTCNDMLKKSKNRPQTEGMHKDNDGEYVMEIPDYTNLPENRLLEKESASHLMHCLEQLAVEQKEIILLRDIQGFSYEEISKILQCSIGTVKSRISRARQKLREIYLDSGYR